MDEEPALLHEPNLMLAILRAADAGPAGLEDAAARLRANLAMAGEPPPQDADELRQRLEEALGLLARAGAVTMAEGGRFRRTADGARLLADHPEGIDATVLWPGVPRAARSGGPGRVPDDPRLPAYDAGLLAFGRGRPLDANPHATDTTDHLAWENGWSEARDAAKEAAPPARATGRNRPRSAP